MLLEPEAGPWPFLNLLHSARRQASQRPFRRALRAASRGLAALAGVARCAACDAPLASSDAGFCHDCNVPSSPTLRKLGSLWVLAGGRFDSSLRDAIHRLKYSGKSEAAEGLSDWWLARLDHSLGAVERTLPHPIPRANNPTPLAVVPIPLHPRRLVERGYNQSTLLASRVAPWLGAKTRHYLTRTRETQAQAGLGRDERAANIATAFQARRPSRACAVVLVDDVATTGATLSAAVQALGKLGVPCVGALVLAVSGD